MNSTTLPVAKPNPIAYTYGKAKGLKWDHWARVPNGKTLKPKKPKKPPSIWFVKNPNTIYWKRKLSQFEETTVIKIIDSVNNKNYIIYIETGHFVTAKDLKNPRQIIRFDTHQIKKRNQLPIKLTIDQIGYWTTTSYTQANRPLPKEEEII